MNFLKGKFIIYLPFAACPRRIMKLVTWLWFDCRAYSYTEESLIFTHRPFSQQWPCVNTEYAWIDVKKSHSLSIWLIIIIYSTSFFFNFFERICCLINAQTVIYAVCGCVHSFSTVPFIAVTSEFDMLSLFPLILQASIADWPSSIKQRPTKRAPVTCTWANSTSRDEFCIWMNWNYVQQHLNINHW